MILAIDPGKSGGVAFRDNFGGTSAYAMPQSEYDLMTYIKSYKLQDTVVAVVEKVQGYVGGEGAPGSAMFNFGYGYGYIVGVLAALDIPTHLIRPQQWQSALQLGKSKDYPTKPAWKRHLRDEAQRRYPHLKVTLATADALLILTASHQLIPGI